MTESLNLSILAIVGLTGAGKTTVTEYLATQGLPKISISDQDDVQSITQQIHGILSAGQHKIVIDGLENWDMYKALKHEFHGNIKTIAITASRHDRHHRLAHRTEGPINADQVDQLDYSEIETENEGGIIALADHVLENNGNTQELYENVDKLLHEIEF